MKDTQRKPSWIMIVLMVVCWFLIVSLAKDLGRVRSGFKRIEEANLKLNKETELNAELKKKMSFTKSDYYKEKVVREKLNMQKPGEVVVVLPDDDKKSTAILDNQGEVEAKNWEKWLRVIAD